MCETTMRVRACLELKLAGVDCGPLALGHDKAQSIIDQITSAYESGNGPPPGGFGFGPQHLAPSGPGFGGPPGFGPPGGGFGGPAGFRTWRVSL